MSFFEADMTHQQLDLITNKWQVYETEQPRISFRASASPECRIHCCLHNAFLEAVFVSSRKLW